MVFCAASHYEKKYYLDPDFLSLPEEIRNELQSTCVLFTEEVGGIILMEFDEKGRLLISTQARDDDGFYDEIGAGLKIKQLRSEKAELFRSLEIYYRIFFLGEGFSEEEDVEEVAEDD